MPDNNNKAKKGFAGLLDLASEVGVIDEPTRPKKKAEAKPSVHKEPSQNQRETVSSEPERNTTGSPPPNERQIYPKSSDGSGGKWILGIIGVIFVIWLISNGEQSSQLPSHNQPSQSIHSPAVKTQSVSSNTGLNYKKPAVGTNNLLSMPEIRWCIREGIRIDAMKNVVDTNKKIEAFNQIVDDYNSRCGNFRYRKGSQSQAERDVEPYRRQIVSEAIREGKQLGGSNQPSYTLMPTSASPSKISKKPNAAEYIRKAQQLLTDLDYDLGHPDGLYGPRTAAAVRAFQRDAGITVDGQINQDLLKILSRAKTENKPRFENIHIEEPVKANVEYFGSEIALSFRNRDIRDVMKIFSAVSERKIVVENDIEAVISINVERPEPWDKILFELVEKYHLETDFTGNTIRIFKKKDLGIQ